MIRLKKMPILAILSHFWPVMTPFQCPKLSMSLFDLVLNGLSEINKKIVNNNDLFIENADFGHYRIFLACYDPVSVAKALN